MYTTSHTSLYIMYTSTLRLLALRRRHPSPFGCLVCPNQLITVVYITEYTFEFCSYFINETNRYIQLNIVSMQSVHLEIKPG